MGITYLICMKEDSSIRLCIHYRDLSGVILKNGYPLSMFEELFDQLQGVGKLSKIDLRLGYP